MPGRKGAAPAWAVRGWATALERGALRAPIGRDSVLDRVSTGELSVRGRALGVLGRARKPSAGGLAPLPRETACRARVEAGGSHWPPLPSFSLASDPARAGQWRAERQDVVGRGVAAAAPGLGPRSARGGARDAGTDGHRVCPSCVDFAFLSPFLSSRAGGPGRVARVSWRSGGGRVTVRRPSCLPLLTPGVPGHNGRRRARAHARRALEEQAISGREARHDPGP